MTEGYRIRGSRLYLTKHKTINEPGGGVDSDGPEGYYLLHQLELLVTAGTPGAGHKGQEVVSSRRSLQVSSCVDSSLLQ
jgi:hypothetical protein